MKLCIIIDGEELFFDAKTFEITNNRYGDVDVAIEVCTEDYIKSPLLPAVDTNIKYKVPGLRKPSRGGISSDTTETFPTKFPLVDVKDNLLFILRAERNLHVVGALNPEEGYEAVEKVIVTPAISWNNDNYYETMENLIKNLVKTEKEIIGEDFFLILEAPMVLNNLKECYVEEKVKIFKKK
jgi:hypothetical protein